MTRSGEREGSVVLALGPTNTGKTHRAVTRMLEHDTGMIGLPLRLLAREVYDRVTAAVGESAVALVTGEEKRIPRAPRYWVCTVEAMPLDLPVAFLAVDEVQLAAHRERGHVFTDRILHARGTHETWFLGADTMAPILTGLLPRARLERQARFSLLRHTGKSGLAGLPPRSVIVAFSAAEVYELAARMREKKGGVAVVLGALSPRTRNAQVALYEAREVQYLVATDAIGMGLNLDVDHVAFASTEKFDGKEHRPLDAAELGQIAGRAGRHRRDGTFGTLNPLPELPPRLVARLEAHDYPSVKRLVWRNAALRFDSIEALTLSLALPVPEPRFVRVEQADDFDLLRMVGARPSVFERATDPASVRLLWDICQVPDYRKLTLFDHATLLEDLFVTIVDRGRLDPTFVATRIAKLDRTDGDIEHLVARLAAMRVWTYVCFQRDWVEPGLEIAARDVEDKLGEALHVRLVERFVTRTRHPSAKPQRAVETGRTGRFFDAIGGMLDDIRRAERDARTRRVEAMVVAPHDAFEIDDAFGILYDGVRVGKLIAGRDLSTPSAVVLDEAAPDAGSRARIGRRLAAFARDVVAVLLAPIGSHGVEGLARGVLWQLERGLGTIDARRAGSEIRALAPEDRRLLADRGIVIGARTVFSRALLAPEALCRRALLVRLYLGDASPALPARGAVSIAIERGVSSETYLACGLLPLGPRAIRVDVVERALDGLAAREAPFARPPELGGLLGVKAKELGRVLVALGYRDVGGDRWAPSADDA